jgi:hypothetical protein
MKLICVSILFFSLSNFCIAQININDLKGEWANEANDHQFFIKITKGKLEVFECGGKFNTGYSESIELKGDTLIASMNCRGEEGIDYTLVFINSGSMILKGKIDQSFSKRSSRARIDCP